MEYVRALMVGGVMAGVAMLGTAWWSDGAIADTQVLVGEGRIAPPNPDDVASEDDRLRELVAALTRREHELDAREEAIAVREATLRELELAFASSTASLQARPAVLANDAVEGGMAIADDAEDAQGGDDTPEAEASSDPCRLHGGITDIYASMRAEEAAPILDRLDDDTLRAVFATMEPRKIASILAVMSRERAVAFTRVLAADGTRPQAR